MAEYISKADAVYVINSKCYELKGLAKNITKGVQELPPADVTPVVHAYWIDTDNYYRRWRCSACSGHTKEAHPPFCPFCGAKMDGEE